MPTLRIISGKAKGKRIYSVPGRTTRPITDRVKESLFNIIGADIVGSKFWDVFSGSGSVGIEAISRGAEFVCFSDNDFQAIKTIRRNIEIIKLDGKYQIIQHDSIVFINREPNEIYDYIFIAPPQYKNLWKQTLLMLDKNPGWLSKDGWVIVQIHPIEYENLESTTSLECLVEFDLRKYGSTLLIFYTKKYI